jgi:hypothetical protein
VIELAAHGRHLAAGEEVGNAAEVFEEFPHPRQVGVGPVPVLGEPEPAGERGGAELGIDLADLAQVAGVAQVLACRAGAGLDHEPPQPGEADQREHEQADAARGVQQQREGGARHFPPLRSEGPGSGGQG